MKKVIFDTSAFLALINNEDGKDIIEPLLANSVMLSVNVSEVVSELITKLHLSQKHIDQALLLIGEIKEFDKDLAVQTGFLKEKYNELSFGERSCIALAQNLNLPLYTCNKHLNNWDFGIEIIQIR